MIDLYYTPSPTLKPVGHVAFESAGEMCMTPPRLSEAYRSPRAVASTRSGRRTVRAEGLKCIQVNLSNLNLASVPTRWLKAIIDIDS
jgi:hypothetical protein